MAKASGNSSAQNWPSLQLGEWNQTRRTLHMLTQMAGKVKLALSPFLNQWWQVTFYLTASGLTSGLIPFKKGVFEVNFDFNNHKLPVRTGDGREKTMALEPKSVADFYREFMENLKSLGIEVSINLLPSEIANPIPFDRDQKDFAYDKEFVSRWHTIQLQTALVMERLRTNFRGKSSPVQFFWGGFDLNATRFSGNVLPDKTDWPKGFKFMRYAESEENFACGFWPGDERFPHPAFYAYIYPAPAGYEGINPGPSFAYFNKELSECIMPYEDVRKAENPEEMIAHFFQTTYIESAKMAGWDIESLVGRVPGKTI
ncbi:MAG: DUF5996 family protein [candidate division Zixibacteria bacterium]|nr:DUF5996 family protein [candidate division Zixibacteria bacterium]